MKLNRNFPHLVGANRSKKYYDYIKKNVSPREYEKYGWQHCVDVTLQNMFDHIPYANENQIYTQFAQWIQEMEGRPLSDEEKGELDDIVMHHCNAAWGLGER